VSKFLIYALIDPYTNEIRYIGRSASGLKRPTEHSCPKNLESKRTHCVSWIKSLNGKKPWIKILEKVNSIEELNPAEVRWIAKAKELGWGLTNHTSGGDGTLGFKHTEEAKRKIWEARVGKSPGIVYTEEVRYACGSSMRGKVLSKEQRAARSKTMGTKPFKVFDAEGNYLGTFYNKSECSRVLGIDRKTISDNLANKIYGKTKRDRKLRFEEIE
jgi:group I intron endonuclease